MGEFRFNSDDALVLPAGSVTSAMLSSTAPAAADKTLHIENCGTNFGHAIGDTPTDEERIVFVAPSAGTIKSFRATLNDTGTTTNIDFDLKVNGTTALSAVVNFTHSDSDKTVKTGTLSTTTFAADDILSIECDQTTTTGAQGPYASVQVEFTAS